MLYYIHGYLSSPEGDKGTLFKKTLNAHPIQYRTCKPEDLIIKDCLKEITKIIKKDPNTILIGSSLGGLLAAATAQNHPNVKQIILLNPAIIPPNTKQTKSDTLPSRIFNEMIIESLFTKPIKTKIHIILGTNDEIIPKKWTQTFTEKQQATIQYVKDDHRLSKTLPKLPEIIQKIIN